MELLIGSFVVLFLFFARDVFLLGSTGDHLSRKLAVYCVSNLVCLLFAIRIWHALAPDAAARLVRWPALWVLTVFLHAVLWFLAGWFKRRPQFENKMWFMAVAPAPMLILSVLAFSDRLTMILGTPDRWMTGAAVSVGWVTAVLAGVLLVRKAGAGWGQGDFATCLSEIASWTGIGILPFTGMGELARVFFNYD